MVKNAAAKFHFNMMIYEKQQQQQKTKENKKTTGYNIKIWTNIQ